MSNDWPKNWKPAMIVPCKKCHEEPCTCKKIYGKVTFDPENYGVVKIGTYDSQGQFYPKEQVVHNDPQPFGEIVEDWFYEQTDSGLWKTRKYTRQGEEGYESIKITRSEIPAGSFIWDKRTYPTAEYDPLGIDQHEGGAKLDSGKPDASLLKDFGLALLEVAKVSTKGAIKYSRGGWQEVPDGHNRYTAAMMRHFFQEKYEDIDEDTQMLHMAQVAWNALARLELYLRES